MFWLMCVGRDSEATAFALSSANERPIEVEAFRARVNFKTHTTFGGCGRDLFEAEGEPFAMQQNAAGGMAHDPDAGRFEGAQEAAGHLAFFQVHVAMNAANNQ